MKIKKLLKPSKDDDSSFFNTLITVESKNYGLQQVKKRGIF